MPSAAWYFQRLKAMSPPEVAFRMRRLVTTQADRFPSLAGTVPAPRLCGTPLPNLQIPEVPPAPYVANAERMLRGRMEVFACHDCFLGDPPDWNRDPKSGVRGPDTPGRLIDYRDESIVGNIKYTWEPSRHLKFVPLAQSFRLTGDRKYLDGLIRLLDSWMTACPYPVGIQWCSALEVAIRLINWSLAWRILGGADGLKQAGIAQEFIDRWLRSVYRHLQFIDSYYSGFSSANNHLIGEAAGVYIGARTWPYWDQCERWRYRSREILMAEISSQTHADGVNAEQAVAYQQFVLDFFILAGLAADDAGDAFPSDYWSTVGRMLEFVAAIMDVNGNVPMIGDADDGFVTELAPEPDFCNFRSLLATGAILLDRPEFAVKSGVTDAKTRWLVADAAQKLAEVGQGRRGQACVLRRFPAGGYYVLGRNLDDPEEVRIVFDAGPLGMGSLAAHGHADALSFTLSVRGVPLVIDPGTYSYHTERFWRDYFRGTSAHNTVRIDGCDQSVIGGSFMWSRHARTAVSEADVQKGVQFIDASHDGYARLADPVTHRRRLAFDCNTSELRIADHLECRDEHAVELFFHFPEYAAVEVEEGRVRVGFGRAAIVISAKHEFEPQLLRGDEKLPLGWISYRFDEKLEACTLRYAGRIARKAVLETVIRVEPAGKP